MLLLVILCSLVTDSWILMAVSSLGGGVDNGDISTLDTKIDKVFGETIRLEKFTLNSSF